MSHVTLHSWVCLKTPTPSHVEPISGSILPWESTMTVASLSCLAYRNFLFPLLHQALNFNCVKNVLLSISIILFIARGDLSAWKLHKEPWPLICTDSSFFRIQCFIPKSCCFVQVQMLCWQEIEMCSLLLMFVPLTEKGHYFLSLSDLAFISTSVCMMTYHDKAL